MNTTTKTNQNNAPAEPSEAGSVQRLVGPFETHETKEWRRRAEILEALGNMVSLANEARLNLNWRETDPNDEDVTRKLTLAGVALRELRDTVTVLWPNASS